MNASPRHRPRRRRPRRRRVTGHGAARADAAAADVLQRGAADRTPGPAERRRLRRPVPPQTSIDGRARRWLGPRHQHLDHLPRRADRRRPDRFRSSASSTTPSAPSHLAVVHVAVHQKDGLTENTATRTPSASVRSTPDDAHDLTTDPYYTGSADTPDYDQSPAQLVFRADARRLTPGFRGRPGRRSSTEQPMLVAPPRRSGCRAPGRHLPLPARRPGDGVQRRAHHPARPAPALHRHRGRRGRATSTRRRSRRTSSCRATSRPATPRRPRAATGAS